MLLQTGHCLIRQFVPEDADALHALLADADVMRYIEPVYSRKQAETFLREAGLCQPPLVYALVWQETDEFIGQVIFHPYEGNLYEIGWLLHPAFWGKGIATEVTRALTAYAIRLGADGCVMECDPRQEATKRIAHKCGFVPEGLRDGLCLFHWEKTAESARPSAWVYPQ